MQRFPVAPGRKPADRAHVGGSSGEAATAGPCVVTWVQRLPPAFRGRLARPPNMRPTLSQACGSPGASSPPGAPRAGPARRPGKPAQGCTSRPRGVSFAPGFTRVFAGAGTARSHCRAVFHAWMSLATHLARCGWTFGRFLLLLQTRLRTQPPARTVPPVLPSRGGGLFRSAGARATPAAPACQLPPLPCGGRGGGRAR